MKYVYTSILFLLVANFCKAQDILSIFATKGPNAQKSSLELFKRYTNPLAESYSWAISMGWNHTARPHRPIGFDISIGTAAVLIPDNKLTYSVDGIDGVRIISGNTQVPTFFGSNTASSVIGVKNDDGTESIIPATRGVNLSVAPLPFFKFGLGIFKNTELMGRIFPKLEYNGIEIKMWGAGIKHNIVQWFYKEKSPFDLSVSAAYTQADGLYPLEQSMVAPVVNPGNMLFTTRGGDFEAILSKTFPLVTFYVSSGFAYSKNNLQLVGDYTLQYNPEETLNIPPNGVTEEYELKAWKFGGGIMLKFGLVFINGDYSYSEYHLISTGLGLTLK
ncbi:DUF6588 family protein [Flammeovirga kamogawensis]|uniref:PorV/PorQ family protein n=1 Tax=Flammeovirga kamogawensis TaxID=373891 RepID=A0ABX8GX91_9BACT|nr:DUF6588 family protein [Flammeovirga kamogawensis]MBB6460583.1 hypothetical protein [Flammeovirga kamogawensis]QWG07941.1 hypothetical protein KM029_03125 [Flammeovirga kamogawensis]TRX69750.1 hypothetical protein EO216_17060 [Flammeovirga kamogawensis]